MVMLGLNWPPSPISSAYLNEFASNGPIVERMSKLFPPMSIFEVSTILSPSHLPVPESEHPDGSIGSHHIEWNIWSFGSNQTSPKPRKFPIAPFEVYSCVMLRPPGPGLKTAVPVSVPPFGINSLFSKTPLVDQVPCI